MPKPDDAAGAARAEGVVAAAGLLPKREGAVDVVEPKPVEAG